VDVSEANGGDGAGPPLLRDHLPEVAAELERALRASGEPALADQVPALAVHAVCGCGDEGCQSLHTAAPHEGALGPDHRTVTFPTSDLVVDVAGGRIAYVEMLGRRPYAGVERLRELAGERS
jgi:hypothetical protein